MDGFLVGGLWPVAYIAFPDLKVSSESWEVQLEEATVIYQLFIVVACIRFLTNGKLEYLRLSDSYLNRK